MATQAEAFDPRAEALAASRYRSGSGRGRMESMEVQPSTTGPEPSTSGTAPPAKSTASQFRNLRTKFEEKDATASGQASRQGNQPLFGSSVSRMKQKFMQTGEPGIDATTGPQHRGRTVDRSPENKRKKVSEGQNAPLAPALDPKRRTSSMDSAQSVQHHHPVYVSPPLSPTHSLPSAKPPSVAGTEPKAKQGFANSASTSQKPADSVPEPAGLSEPTNHVQRFNYTMALFARMEEETRKAQEREKVALRKTSPSRLSLTASGTSSPLLSPSTQGNHSFPSPSTDSLQRARRSKSIPQENASEARTSRPFSDSITQAVELPELTAEQERLRSHSNSETLNDYENGAANTTQRVTEKGSVRGSSDFSQRKSSQGSYSSSTGSSDRDRSSQQVAAVAEDPELRPPSVLPHSSRLEHSTRPTLRAQQPQQAKSTTTSQPGLSSSAPQTSTPSTSAHSRSQVSDNSAKHPGPSLPSSSLPSGSGSGPDTDPVVRRVSRSPKTGTDSTNSETAKKRLSREEIESALERADSYLANLESVPDPRPVKKPEYQGHSESSSAAARRRFLYGDTSSSPSPVSSSSSSPSKRRSVGQEEQVIAEEVMVAQKTVTEQASAPRSTQSTSGGSSAFDKLSSLLADVADDDTTAGLGLENDGQRLPPSYHEATEPPPYDVATSTASMLISQRLSQSEEPESLPAGQSGAVNTRPVPVPRRAAPPVPSHPPASRVTPPPPAPEPSSGEYVRNLRTQGSRHAVILDKDTADDLVLPEEHIAHHNLNGLQNGAVEVTATNDLKPGLLSPRELGDGKEDVDAGALSDSEPLEIDYNNLSYIEIAPISSAEEEDDSSEDEIIYHKPSRVAFSRNPIKVYATFSTNDYDRRNEDVDPVAASAEYELEKRVEKMDVFPVDLQKGSEGLGLSIIGMGVGADAGLEKLGIFVKTLTPNGAAQRSKQIQVNDQIIEVDGKSLVGVTQSYAASVLRNTSGHVKFLIGREKDPSKSEVARLIQQSLAQDRRREEMREKEQQRLRQLEDSFEPKDEVLERHAHSHDLQQQQQQQLQHQQRLVDQRSPDMDEDGEETEEGGETSSVSGDEEKGGRSASYDIEQLQLEQEITAGDTTPQSPPHSNGDASSPDTSETRPVVESLHVEQPETSSSGSLSPDGHSEKLYVQVKEGQYKLAVAEAEVAKLKAKIVVLDEAETQKKALEKKVEDLTRKFQERDQHFDSLKRELGQYKDMMVASQSQHIELERKVRELGALEKKYHKAKKLIKDYQQREKDFIQERESLLEQQNEKDQQYNALVKSLKDRIFTLEKDLKEVQKAAGLPVVVPKSEEVELVLPASISSQQAPLVKATLNGVEEPVSPIKQSAEDFLETSTSSEVSETAATPDSEMNISLDQMAAEESETSAVSSPMSSSPKPVRVEFDAVVSSSPLLDSSANRDKANLAAAGGNANRRPPSKKIMGSDLMTEEPDSASTKSEVTENGSVHSGQPGQWTTDQTEEESGLDMWNKHDSESTVRKSELKKRKQFQQEQQQQQQQLPPPPPVPTKPLPLPVGGSASTPSGPSHLQVNPTPPKPLISPKPRPRESKLVIPPPRNEDSCSDTSSSVSQTSYDPNRPENKSGLSEIPAPADDSSTNGDGGVTLISKSSGKGFSFPKFNWKLPKSGGGGGGGGGVVLLSNKSLGSKLQSASDPGMLDSGGITLVSRRLLDTAYTDTDGSSVNSDTLPASMMVTEPDEDITARAYTLNISGTPAAEENPSPNKRSQNQFQSGPITEWNSENVCHWLMALELEKYSALFTEKGITGAQLLQLDSSRLKALGISSSKDRELLKKKIKEMKVNVEREKKIQEKERKLKEKEQKKLSKKK